MSRPFARARGTTRRARSWRGPRPCREGALAPRSLISTRREGWRIGLPSGGKWREALNTDSRFYGGSDLGNGWGIDAEESPWNGLPYSAAVTLPPLAVVWLVPDETGETRAQ